MKTEKTGLPYNSQLILSFL